MSPVGSALRVRMRMFPSLVNCMTIDWFMPWPDDALISVAERYLQNMGDLSDDHKVCLQMHVVQMICPTDRLTDAFELNMLEIS